MKFRSQEGFTLSELMVVVALVGVAATLAAPSLSASIKRSQHSRVSHRLTSMFRIARNEAVGYGRAYLVRVNRRGNNNFGAMEIYRGVNGSCDMNDWQQIMDRGCQGNPMCVDWYNPYQFGMVQGDGRNRIAFYPEPGAHVADICFQPNGEMRGRRDSDATNHRRFSKNFVRNGGFELRMYQMIDGRWLRTTNGYGSTDYVLRRIMIPSRGQARLIQ